MIIEKKQIGKNFPQFQLSHAIFGQKKIKTLPTFQ